MGRFSIVHPSSRTRRAARAAWQHVDPRECDNAYR